MKRGPAGNEETLQQIRAFVLRDYNDVAIQDFANGLIAGVSSHNPALVANTLFLFTRSFSDREGRRWGITYRSDPYGFEQIQDTRTTIQKGVGDCGDKTTLLLTLAGAVGIKGRAVVLSYHLPAFQHVYCELFYGDKWHVYDPTPEEALPGQQSRGLKRAVYRIWPDDLDTPDTLAGIGIAPPKGGMGRTTKKLIGAGVGVGAATATGGLKAGLVTGAQIGVSFIPVVGPILAPIVGVLAGLFGSGVSKQDRKIGSDFDQADKLVAAYLVTLSAKADAGTLTADDMISAGDQITQLAQLAEQQKGVAYVAKQWAAEQPRYAQWLTDLHAKLPAKELAAADGTAPAAGSGILGQLFSGTGSGISPLWLVGGGLAIFFLINALSQKSGR